MTIAHRKLQVALGAIPAWAVSIKVRRNSHGVWIVVVSRSAR